MEQGRGDDARIENDSIDGSDLEYDLPQDGDSSASTGTSLHLSPGKQDNDKDHHELKWQRLKKHYSDQYLELFNAACSEDADDKSLRDSQYGCVEWTGPEKSQFFSTLSRKGRHDLPSLAAAVQTKSQVEIKDYVDRLKEAERERQMFASHAKSISHADIDAAVEIGEECEAMLENAADALSALQESYDQASARGRRHEPWIVDSETAERLDAGADTADTDQHSDSEVVAHPSKPVAKHSMFHLATFLELSKRLFMNIPEDSAHTHWTQLAENDEEPNLTMDVIDTFYSLVVSLVQRILQTALFLAKSRIRAQAEPGRGPANLLKDIDVEAALDVINMPLSGFDYWIGFVKRSKLRVVVGNNRKGESVRQQLSPHQIEDVLSIRRARGRSRSLSSLVSMSSAGSDTTENDEVEGQDVLAEDSRDEGLDHEDSSGSSPSEPLAGNDGYEQNDTSEGGDTSDRISAEPETNRYISRKRRHLMIEEEQDEYMERLDQANRLREEAHLQQLLGNTAIKGESPDELGQYPRMRRKTKDELNDWSEMRYHDWWEIVEVEENGTQA